MDQDLTEGLSLIPLEDAEFNAIRKMVYQTFGINLTVDKRALVLGRLQGVVKGHGFKSFREYVELLKTDKTEQSLVELVNRISTNHTFFFREPEHFAFLRNVGFHEMVKRHDHRSDRDIRIWSAGCSSGEEPYTIMIEMLEFFGADYQNWHAGILATDVSAKALTKAKNGIYDQNQLENVSENIRRKYFINRDNGLFEVIEQIKKEVTFRHFNLMNSRFPFKKKFDLILCRNVMIYFDQPTRDALIKRFADWLLPGGYLFIGHSESLGRENANYHYVQPAVYRRKG